MSLGVRYFDFGSPNHGPSAVIDFHVSRISQALIGKILVCDDVIAGVLGSSLAQAALIGSCCLSRNALSLLLVCLVVTVAQEPATPFSLKCNQALKLVPLRDKKQCGSQSGTHEQRAIHNTMRLYTTVGCALEHQKQPIWIQDVSKSGMV